MFGQLTAELSGRTLSRANEGGTEERTLSPATPEGAESREAKVDIRYDPSGEGAERDLLSTGAMQRPSAADSHSEESALGLPRIWRRFCSRSFPGKFIKI